VATAALVAVPPLHRLDVRHGFTVALSLVAACAAFRFAWVGLEAGPYTRYTIGGTAFFFFLGLAGARATSLRQRLVVLGAAGVLVPGFFGDVGREALILTGLALLLLVATVPLPRVLMRPVTTLAGASLAVYVTHWQVYPPLEDAGHPWAALVCSLAVGVAWSAATRPARRRVAGWFRPAARRESVEEMSATPCSRSSEGQIPAPTGRTAQ